MTKQKPTLEELIEQLDNAINPVRQKDRYGTSVCVRCDALESIRNRLLAAQKMAEALRFYAEKNNWRKTHLSGSHVDDDHGMIARDALKEHGERQF